MKPSVLDVVFVALQFVLFVAFVFDVSDWRIYFQEYFLIIAVILLIVGAIIILVGLSQLRKQLSPFPSPVENAKLIVTGIFKYIRHPIYSGILMTFVGLSLIADSGYKLLITFFLWLVFYGKSLYEEKKLIHVFPEYQNYKNSAGRFLPKFYPKQHQGK